MREQEEYTALRATIRERGTTRVWVFTLGMAAWAALLLATLALALPPAVILVPLLLLAATFEAVLALHAGVERIGRYLFVFHGDDWERAAGAFGRPSGAIAVDPLFTTVFLIAAIVTLLPLAAVAPVPQEFAIVGLAELAFFVRVLRAKVAAGKQRAIDAERFSYLRAADRDTTTQR